MANSHGLPVIIHNREADDDIYEHIKEIRPAKGGILHCFSSDYAFAKKFLDMGFYISFAGNLTYKNPQTYRKPRKKLPWIEYPGRNRQPLFDTYALSGQRPIIPVIWDTP
jgi:Tat protein secretion system quality control protein TatD with DNase activity